MLTDFCRRVLKRITNFFIFKAAFRILKLDQDREEAEERAKTDPQVIVPPSIQEIILNCFHTDEVNHSP